MPIGEYSHTPLGFNLYTRISLKQIRISHVARYCNMGDSSIMRAHRGSYPLCAW